ncbi:transposable element Tcb2 transposase [Trichonephila clavipes]|nr:transposable element Tcb2 transposase [Trichonephila clavipes]
MCAANDTHPSIPSFEVVPLTRKLDCVFSDISGFNLSREDNHVHVWRPHGKRLNPAFALQRHTTPTAGVIVWTVILTIHCHTPNIDPWHSDIPLVLP